MKRFNGLSRGSASRMLGCGLVAVVMAVVGACNGSDCPLNNTVMQKCVFYGADSTALTIGDTLTVTVRDSVVLNRLTDGTSVKLPMSYNEPADTLVFLFKPAGAAEAVADTVVVSKTNTPHFVSLDCARSMYHTITGVSCSKREPDLVYKYAIDRVVIKNAEVNYDEQENLQIFFDVYQ